MAIPKWEYIKNRFPEIESWLRSGLNERQIIQNLGISKTTFEKYKKEQPELLELLKSGVKKQVAEVENSLYKAATGYHYYEEQAFKCKTVYWDEKGRRCEKEELQTETVQRFKAPEVSAITFFLKNKDKNNWNENPTMQDLKREEFEWRKQHSDGFGDW